MSTSVYVAPDITKNKNMAQKVVSGVIGIVTIFFPAAGAAAAAVGAVTSVIGKIGDSKKRAQFEKDFASLSQAKQVQIGKIIQAEQDETKKLDLLSNYIVQAKIENEQNKDAEQFRNYILISGIAVVFLVGVIVYKVKQSKK